MSKDTYWIVFIFVANYVDNVIYLINRGPCTDLDDGILKETWIGKSMHYSFLKIFECEAYVHIDKKKNRNKLDAKTRKCYFSKYGIDGMGFKL